MNGQGSNTFSLHTKQGCTVPPNINSTQHGRTIQTDCAYQPGCASVANDSKSFGAAFNQNHGGYFALLRDTQSGGMGIRAWYWGADEAPADVTAITAAPNTTAPPFVLTNDTALVKSLGEPAANFGAASAICPMDKLFGKHEIIFDITLCGYWAGPSFAQASGCPSMSCTDFVAQNASAFANARWEIDYVRIYTDKCSGAAAYLRRVPFALLGIVTTLTALVLGF